MSILKRGCRPALTLLGVWALCLSILPIRGFSPSTITWNPPGDPYGDGGTAGVPIPSPYVQSEFTVEYNGYAEEDSHALTFGTHWTGRVGANFLRSIQTPDNTEIKISRTDGSEFWLNGLNFTLDATSVKSINVQGFRDGSAVTELVTISGLSNGDANFFFNDPAFGNIDSVHITASAAIRGFFRPMTYHPAPLVADAGIDLNPGDIAIIGVSTITSDFAFMTLADLPGNTYVYFTTQGWNRQTDDWIGGTPALVTAGYTANGYFWKTPSGGVPKGTILNYIGATGEISSDWVWLNYDESLYFPSDQWLVFTKSSNSPSNVSFVYAANFSDTDQDASGFQTSFGDNDLFRTAVPPGLVAATSGQEGSAFGLAPTSGYDVALKPSALTDGMTRAEVLQAIHTPSNWEVYDDEAYIGFDFSTRYPASITISGGASNEAPTDLNLSNLSVNQSAGISAFIGTLSSTDANEGDAFVYSLVAGEGDTNNSLFDISGSSLLARNAAAMPAGSYSLRVQTDDALGGTYSESFMITVVDDVGPVVSEGHISISGASGTGGAFRIGDTITATWNNTAEGDNNTDTLSAVTVDFSSFGGGTAVSAINSSGMWTASLVVPAGSIDEQNRTLSVTATDAAGNTTTTVASTTATLDNIAPTVTDGSISISGASGTGDAFRIGDTITVSWNNTAGGDNNNDTISAVTVDFSSFGGGTAVSASNRSGTWTATYTLAAGSISASGQNVSVRAIDDAGNETRTFDSTGATIDIIPPEILSIKRKSPLAQLVREGPLLFEVTFSEDVTSVDASSFAVTAVNGSTVKGEITEISGGPKVYEVTVGITEGRGEFRLDVVK